MILWLLIYINGLNTECKYIPYEAALLCLF